MNETRVNKVKSHMYFDNFNYLKEKSQNFSTQVFSPSLFMIHDATAGGQHNITARDNEIKKMTSNKLVQIY